MNWIDTLWIDVDGILLPKRNKHGVFGKRLAGCRKPFPFPISISFLLSCFFLPVCFSPTASADRDTHTDTDTDHDGIAITIAMG